MRHRKKTVKLGRPSAARQALLGALARSLVRDERIVTTLAKAKAVQPLADRMISLAKKNTLAARRRAGRILQDRRLVRKLFSEIGPRFTARTGGYTRILKKASGRRGDGASMALLVYTEEGVRPVKEKKKKAPAAEKAKA